MNNIFGPLDACLKAAVIRSDHNQEAVLDLAARELGQPGRDITAQDMGSIALWYAHRGMRVFPLTPGAKMPLARSHGVNDATTDPAMIARMFPRMMTPERNIGIATGDRYDVIDIDTERGYTAFIDMIQSDPSHAAWLEVVGVSQTPRGLHLWVPAVPGAINDSGHAIDYRGKGGYVVAPPSHVGGTVYRWLLPPTT